MGTYVIGDIHGCYDALIKMLKKIHYCDNDEVICIGDYIDRGKQNYKMLKWMETCPNNILLLQGNHEAEYTANIDIMSKIANNLQINIYSNHETQLLYRIINNIPEIHNAYFDNYQTIYNLIYNHSIDLQKLIYWSDIMKSMSYHYQKTVNGQLYIMVHAGYKKSDVEYCIYAREESFSKNSTIIAGHTPTIIKKEFSYNSGNIYKKYNKELNSTYINIDCGYVYNTEESKLACIRLEDLKEYYI